MPNAMLRIDNVSRHFSQRQGIMAPPRIIKAVQEVSLSLGKQQTLGIVGESGSGKSTIARMVARLLAPSSGDIFLDGESLVHPTPGLLTSLPARIQMVFQDPYSSLNPRMRVGASIAEPLIAAKWNKAEIKAKTVELLEQVGLPKNAANLYPHEFSGGQRQRIALARAIALQPDIVICDEPVSSLDASIQAQILNLLQSLQEQHSLSYLFISHDLAVISHISDYIAVMYLGRVVEEGPAELIFTNPLHPYTKLLLAAAKGLPPEVTVGMGTAAPLGSSPCDFLPRCPQKKPECLYSTPELKEVTAGHFARCYNA